MQAERTKLTDDRIKLVVETCLRHGIHRLDAFETAARGRLSGYRERIGNVMSNISNQDMRTELLQKLQSVSGSRAAAAVQAQLGEAGGAGPAGMVGGLSAVGGVLRSQAESVGSFIEQGAEQMRERLSVRR
jgi:hypothetical protein